MEEQGVRGLSVKPGSDSRPSGCPRHSAPQGGVGRVSGRAGLALKGQLML